MSSIAPLLPPDVDLSDFGYMPLDVRRLRDSRLACTVSGDEFRAAVLLWCASWHQVPAASLPDDDFELSLLSGYGRVVKEWKKVKEGALHGWIKCSDGRLYHPVVAEKAAVAWNEKREHAWSKECDRIRKENKKRETSNGIPMEMPERPVRISSVIGDGIPPEMVSRSTGIPAEISLKGEGKGKGEGKKEERVPTTSAADAAPVDDRPPSARDELWRSGAEIVQRLLGKSEAQSRGFLGRLLKAAGDDCARVGGLLREADSLRPADPQAWMMAAASRGAATAGPAGKLGHVRSQLDPQFGALVDAFADMGSPPEPTQFDLEMTRDEHGAYRSQ